MDQLIAVAQEFWWGFFVLAAVLWYVAGRPALTPTSGRDHEALALFGLSPREWRVIGTDLGHHPNPVYLRAGPVHGAPDALFASRDGRRLIVGELKSRRHRGHITDYERYQTTLYCGAALRQQKAVSVSALIRYADKVVPLAYDNSLFRHLLDLAPEAIQAEQTWTPIDPTPLKLRVIPWWRRLLWAI